MRRFISGLAVLAVLLTACGGSPDAASDPKGALKSAFEKLASSDSQTVTLDLDSDADSLVAASEGKLSAEDAQKFLDSSLVISVKGDSPDNAQFQLALEVGGTDGLEIRTVDQNLYVRADVDGLTETFGVPQAKVDKAVQEAMAKGLDFIQPAVEGQWLAFNGAQGIAQGLAAAGGASPADSDMSKKVAESFYKSLDENSTITSAGSDSVGDHIVAAVDLKAFFQDISSGLTAFFPAPPEGMPSADNIPEGSAKVDVWIADDTVKQIEFDFKQLGELPDAEPVPDGVDKLAVRMTFDAFDGEVEAPDGAVTVDMKALMQQFMGGMGATDSGSGSSGGDSMDPEALCDQLKDAPKDVKEQFAEQCPDLGA